MSRVLIAPFLLACSLVPQDGPEDVQERLKATVSFLASDELKGRAFGTREGEKAGRWRTRSEGVTENAKGVRFCFSSAPPAV